MSKRWLAPEPIIIPDSMQEYFDISPYLAEVLVKKGMNGPSSVIPFLDPARYHPADPCELPGVTKGTDRLLRAIHHKERIGIWGDFDVDGQTSTALLVNFFRQLGIPVRYHIPIRSEESHGIRKEPLQQFLAQGVDVLVTCDTGITAHDALRFATQAGVDVILTDHHIPPEQLPDALTVIDPHFAPPEHAYSALSGVGTAYILTRQLAMELGMQQEWEHQALDLVAMGTIADVAPLIKENRYMVQVGLRTMRQHPRLGIRELLATAGSETNWLNEQDVSFTIAPRLNALGRLGDANPLVEFLLTDDLALARRTATELEGLNNQRKMLVDQVYQAAIALIEQDPAFPKKSLIILSNPTWPAGVLGIVANHLVDTYAKPAILLSGDDQGNWKGSARSVDGIDITELLQKNADLLLSFGGHAMAAGLAMKRENLEKFSQAMNANAALVADIQKIESTLAIDAYLPLKNVDERFMQVLDTLAPFGAGNPSPVFLAEQLQVVNFRYLDRDRVHRSILMTDADGQQFEVKWWHAFDTTLPTGTIDLAYSIRRSVFRGNEKIEIEWVDARNAMVETLPALISKPQTVIQDFRFSIHAEQDLQAFLQTNQAACWGENLLHAPVPCYNRLDIPQHAALAFLNMPPSAAVLQQVLSKVKPDTIALFHFEQNPLNPKQFLQTVLGLLKYALREKEGKISLNQYAALTGLTVEVMDIALHLLAADGQIILNSLNEDERTVEKGDKIADPEAKKAYQDKLIGAMKAIQAFQRFLLRIPPEKMLADYGKREK